MTILWRYGMIQGKLINPPWCDGKNTTEKTE